MVHLSIEASNWGVVMLSSTTIRTYNMFHLFYFFEYLRMRATLCRPCGVAMETGVRAAGYMRLSAAGESLRLSSRRLSVCVTVTATPRGLVVAFRFSPL